MRQSNLRNRVHSGYPPRVKQQALVRATREGCKGQVWGENREVCVAHWKEPHGADRERVGEGVSILEVDALEATNELGEPLGSSRTPQQHYKS